jgi:hypothetical protein
MFSYLFCLFDGAHRFSGGGLGTRGQEEADLTLLSSNSGDEGGLSGLY